LDLCVSYQYQIKKENLTSLYELANTDYQETFNKIARDIIIKIASDYTVNEYRNDRKTIGDRMMIELNKELQSVYAE
jgi:hypothetical protein